MSWTPPRTYVTAELITGSIMNTDHRDNLLSLFNPSARVAKSAQQSIPNLTLTTLTFDVEDYDTDTIHDQTKNVHSLTCHTAGNYLIWAYVWFTTNGLGAATLKAAWILKNNANICGDVQQPYAGQTYSTEMSLVVSCAMAVADYVHVNVQQASGGAQNVGASFGMTRVSGN
jgi:hypothetical protein